MISATRGARGLVGLGAVCPRRLCHGPFSLTPGACADCRANEAAAMTNPVGCNTTVAPHHYGDVAPYGGLCAFDGMALD